MIFVLINFHFQVTESFIVTSIVYAFCDQESVEDEKTRKKREKMEKKASRPKFVKTRTR